MENSFFSELPRPKQPVLRAPWHRTRPIGPIFAGDSHIVAKLKVLETKGKWTHTERIDLKTFSKIEFRTETSALVLGIFDGHEQQVVAVEVRTMAAACVSMLGGMRDTGLDGHDLVSSVPDHV